jgi:hypothetical protein
MAVRLCQDGSGVTRVVRGIDISPTFQQNTSGALVAIDACPDEGSAASVACGINGRLLIQQELKHVLMAVKAGMEIESFL